MFGKKRKIAVERERVRDRVKAFIDRHDDHVLPIVRAVLQKRFPGAAALVEAIREAKESKLPSDTKQVTIEGLQEMMQYADENPSAEALLNSTVVSKFITPFNLVCCSIAFYGALITDILHYWQILPNRIDPALMTTITATYGMLHGVHIYSRAEIKKSIGNEVAGR